MGDGGDDGGGEEDGTEGAGVEDVGAQGAKDNGESDEKHCGYKEGNINRVDVLTQIRKADTVSFLISCVANKYPFKGVPKLEVLNV